MVYSSTVFDPLLNPVLEALGPLPAMIIVSLAVALLTTLIYKYATDQEKMKSLKATMKRYRKKISAVKDDRDKAMKLQREMMKVNGEYMRHSFKSMLFTIIPVMLFLGWFAAHFAFNPILPGESFNVTVELKDSVDGNVSLVAPQNITVDDAVVKNGSEGVVSWTGISGPKGTYDFSVRHDPSGEEQFFSVIITDQQHYENPVHLFEDSDSVFSRIEVGMEKLLMFEGVPVLGSLPLIKKAGWLGAYILFSLIFTTVLRKVMGVA
ncbi:MAG: EMC3/TMCO1 family protein [Candidatus Woesearchaeota archaeon]